MKTGKRTPRLLGAAFLVVFVSSVAAFLLPQSLHSGSMSDSLAAIADNLTLMRISILVELITSASIVVLAALLYVILRPQNRIMTLVAFGWYLAEAITLAVSKVGSFALIPLSLEYVGAGAPDASYYQLLGTLFHGVDRWAYDIHMWFFCLGGILWYSLFFRSKHIPRALSVWGIAAVSLALAGTVMGWLGMSKSLFLIVPNALFEVAIGLWLLVRGIKTLRPEA